LTFKNTLPLHIGTDTLAADTWTSLPSPLLTLMSAWTHGNCCWELPLKLVRKIQTSLHRGDKSPLSN